MNDLIWWSNLCIYSSSPCLPNLYTWMGFMKQLQQGPLASFYSCFFQYLQAVREWDPQICIHVTVLLSLEVSVTLVFCTVQITSIPCVAYKLCFSWWKQNAYSLWCSYACELNNVPFRHHFDLQVSSHVIAVEVSVWWMQDHFTDNALSENEVKPKKHCYFFI